MIRAYYGTFILLLLVVMNVHAQNIYDVANIPPALKSRANAIIRNMETVVEVKDNNVSLKVKKVVTVLNKNGDGRGALTLWYSAKSSSVKSMKGTVYNESGMPSSKISLNDMDDQSAINDFSLFEDSRVKHFSPSIINYPYTVVYEYEMKYGQNLLLPNWYPNEASDIAVQKSSYQFICKPEFKIRFKESNYPGKVVKTDDAKQTSYYWEVNNVATIKEEPYGPDTDNFLISVKIAPEQFNYSGFKGTFSTWDEYGKWLYNSLIKDRTELPADRVAQMQELTKNCTTAKQKAKLIYEFMQKKTRYISVQVGVGGHQPMKASEVDQLGYGDCKALVNYTQSLLKAVDIPSYYCVVTAGRDIKKSMYKDFASINQGNHIILCLPLKNDTTWLECTSKESPFGFLGDFTDDRTVLACSAEGGKLMQTPKLSALDNKQLRKATITVNDNGDIEGSMETIFSGAQYDNRNMLVDQAFSEQEKQLKRIYDTGDLQFKSIKIKQDKAEHPSTTESIQLSARSYGAINGESMYLPLNIFNRQGTIAEVRNRKYPVYINRGYVDEDIIVYSLPPGYKLGSKPENITLKSAHGSYSATFSMEGNKLTYSRKMQLNDGTFPANTYEEFVDLMKQINSSDGVRLVLTKKVN